jgi:hypothetical protein
MRCRPWVVVARARSVATAGAEADLFLIDASENGRLCKHSVGGSAWPATRVRSVCVPICWVGNAPDVARVTNPAGHISLIGVYFAEDPVVNGLAKPSFIENHRLPLEAAPDAYDKFDRRVDGYTKVVLKPGLAA